MALRLSQKSTSSVPLEVEGILPETVRDKSLDEIRSSEIFQGNTKVALGEFFDVSGDPTDELIDWEGDLSGVHWIGAGLTCGIIRVHGNAGRHVGSEMTGGEICVEGDVSDWLGGEMHGGRIVVQGNAGHLVGAAYRGSARGMTGGTILVRGKAGNEIGAVMRRGLIAVGSAGDLVAFNMLAGSVLVFGPCGIRHGAGMRRGTLAFFGDPPPLLPTFRHACRFQPPAIELLLRHLRSLGYPHAQSVTNGSFDLYNGDLLEGGRGELLTVA